MRSPAAIFAVCMLFAAEPARGEVFLLRSGGRIEGDQLNRDREPGQPYEVRTGEGVRLALAESLVQRVVVKSDLDKQYEALLPKVPRTAEGHWTMAEWCREAGLLDQRRKHLQAVIELDPNHEEAHRLLGYSRFGGRWLTTDEYMQAQGFIRYKGAWRVKQEVEIEARDRERELAEKQWRRDIRRWLGQVADGSRHAETAVRSLADIRDINAIPALTEILADKDQPKASRLRCLDILARLPAGLATETLLKVAMEDPDDQLRDRCLDEIQRGGTHLALPKLIADLQHKDNKRVNRAAQCLGRLGDTEATLPLINALVTEHTIMVSPGGGGGGGGGMPLSFGAGSGPGQGGLGSFGVGGRPKPVKKKFENPAVRDALAALHASVNFQFDVDAWRRWYIERHTTPNVDLRRDE